MKEPPVFRDIDNPILPRAREGSIAIVLFSIKTKERMTW